MYIYISATLGMCVYIHYKEILIFKSLKGLQDVELDARSKLEVPQGRGTGHPPTQLLSQLLSHSTTSEEFNGPNFQAVGAVLLRELL